MMMMAVVVDTNTAFNFTTHVWIKRGYTASILNRNALNQCWIEYVHFVANETMHKSTTKYKF